MDIAEFQLPLCNLHEYVYSHLMDVTHFMTSETYSYHVYALRVKIKPFSVEITKNSIIKPENEWKISFWK